MTRRRCTLFRFGRKTLLLLFVGLLNMVIHTSVSGLEEQPEKALSLTAGDVKSLRQKVEETEDLNEETKARILETCDKALARLTAAEDWSSKAASFDRLREEAPEATKALEEELRGPPRPKRSWTCRKVHRWISWNRSCWR